MKCIFLSFVNDEFQKFAQRLYQLLREAKSELNLTFLGDRTRIPMYLKTDAQDQPNALEKATPV